MIAHLDFNSAAKGLALSVDQYADVDKPFDLLVRFDGKRAHAEFFDGGDFEFSCCKREKAFLDAQEASKRPGVG